MTEARSIERPLGFILDISAAITWLTHSHHAVVICLGLLNWYRVLSHDIDLLFVQIDVIILHFLIIIIRASIITSFAALSCVRFLVLSLVSSASLRLGQLLITLQLFIVFVD